MSLINEIIIFLIAAVIAVPISKKLGMGSVIGYLAAGIVIGPWGLGAITGVEEILHIAELGVVLLLFIIGLELQPTRLRVLHKPIFLFGSLQFFVTAVLMFAISMIANLDWRTAMVIGLCLSLSSTAFALQLLAEKNQLVTQHGRAAFAILLFQDLIVIPILALLPLLSPESTMSLEGEQLFAAGKAIAIIVAIGLAGHYLIRPLLRLVAHTKNNELFSAASLLVVLGTATLMQAVGLSMALGAFMAGVLLADSEFRHELEANIEPFKGLLLGLFFISVGMSVDIDLIIAKPVTLLVLAIALIALKAIVLFCIGRFFNKQAPHSALNLALVISQGGEFAFVILHQSGSLGIIDSGLSDALIVIVTLSMCLTPILLLAHEKWQDRWVTKSNEPEYDQIADENSKVIIAGFGRFGQIVARMLRMKNISFTALESSFEQVDFVRKFGNKIYFGNAARLDLLRAAGAETAEIFVLSIVDSEASVKVAEAVKKNFPHLKVFARARNRQHAYRLMDINVDYVIRETFLSSVELSKNVLLGLGLEASEADKVSNAFRDYDENLVRRQHAIHHDEEQVIASAQQAALELENLFKEDSSASDTQQKPNQAN